MVEENLEEELVAAHLGLAMLFLAVLLWIWRSTRPELIGVGPAGGRPRGTGRSRGSRRASSSARSSPGGYMAGTQKYGRADYQLGDGAHHACGKQFPACNDEFMPFGEARLVDIHLTHRLFMYLAVAAVLALVIVTLQAPSRPRARARAPGSLSGSWPCRSSWAR